MRASSLTALIALCLVLAGCSVWGKPQPGFAGATGGEQLQRAFFDAIKGKRWTDVEHHLSTNFLLVTPARVYDRAAALERIQQMNLSSYMLADFNVQPQGSDMVLTYTASMNGTINGQPLPSEPQRVVSTWQEVGGNWTLISQVNVGK